MAIQERISFWAIYEKKIAIYFFGISKKIPILTIESTYSISIGKKASIKKLRKLRKLKRKRVSKTTDPY